MSQSVPQRWLVLPPCADAQVWHSALQAQAQAAGLRLVIGDQPRDQADLILIEDVKEALTAGARPEDMALLLSQAGPLVGDLASQDANPARHPSVTRATDLTCRAIGLLAHRRFSAQQLAQKPVAVFPDLLLHLPQVITTPVSPRNQALVDAMKVYVQDQVTWSPDLLDIYAKKTGQTDDSRSYDATGKPRFFAHGPYLTMPTGHWKAVIKLGFSAPLVGKAYRVDWGGLTEFSQLVFRPDKPGVYEIEMDWQWSQPAPCEIRLLLMEGIFDGEISLNDIQISRI